jgi:hypothetical protein
MARGRTKELRAEIRTDLRMARHATGKTHDPFAEQVAKVHLEITGRPLDTSG